MTRQRRFRVALAVLLAFALGLATLPAPRVARAVSCTVTSTADSGASTLRFALAFTACDTIAFALPGAAPWTINLSSELVIDRSVTITGPGADKLTLRHLGPAAPDGGILSIVVGTVAISGLTIKDGKTLGTPGAGVRVVGSSSPTHQTTSPMVTLTGVAIANNRAQEASGGGLYASLATVTLTDTVVSGNESTTSNSDAVDRGGGGLYATSDVGEARLTLLRSSVSGNRATGPNNAGGGIALHAEYGVRRATLTITDSTVSGNSATGAGGGLFGAYGTVTVSGTTIDGNTASDGGGMDLVFSHATLTGSTISGNTAAYSGGLEADGASGSEAGETTVTNSTISGNTATVDIGGVWGAGGLTLVHTTVTGNRAAGRIGGLYADDAPTTVVRKSVIAGNIAGAAPSDCVASGTLTTGDDNVFGGGGGCPVSATDIEPTVPLDQVLDPTLADNGGPTKTHALVVGSPAINLVPAAQCAVTTDQRGIARPQGAGCDAGAHEFVPAALPDAPAFGDVPGNDPALVAIGELARRGIINGCDSSANPPLFCPADTTLREQMAALIVRAMPGWADETWPNTFTDQTDDAELMRRVGTLQHYSVAGGYNDCPAQAKVAPCYGPLDPVLRAQAISFVARAMVAKGYWTQQTADPALYGGALNGTGHEQDAATYWYYSSARGGVPDYPAAGGFPLGETAPRSWFARLLWTAIQGTPAAP